MTLVKCKMCGGDLVLVPDSTVVECEYCGTQQTVPSADNEKKMTLFNRANRLRFACEFDKAAGIYEAIVADFPEEAEAYWGLVLCKYGIEYVDDPATAKKIPTCHRSSFDSVMDDENFEQALENADAAARKVYRAEAKQIEEIRKGIIEVSSKEDPYDIFICYKETDENGDRTLDSVLAQDIYDALTEKGYRTFFARIILEDKLGQEYEPYIFAALNSAKIMLAVGTDYEYFNAVWVKNEWSRFLHLIASGQKKTLIPCYKNIDAYDMPKEFAKLQAQDLGKVGAIQDLMRGIEKILPRSKPVNIMQEKVVVGGAGSNKITSLLDRGNMALEDGDWAKADSFFEDVLNNDSKNAQAYLGKTLAAERCRTIDAFIRKRKKETETAQTTVYQMEPEENHTQHIASVVSRYYVENYLNAEDLQGLYSFDFSYSSELPCRVRQKKEEEQYWASHKLISRAEKFSTGSVKTMICDAKAQLFSTLDVRIAEAQKKEAAALTQIRNAYSQHIDKADRNAKTMFDVANQRREKLYGQLSAQAEKAKTEKNPEALIEIGNEYKRLTNYRDSLAKAAECLNLASDITRHNQAKEKRGNMIFGTCLCIAVAACILFFTVIRPFTKYKEAEQLLAAGDYAGAISAFEELGSYNDSAERANQIRYVMAEMQLESGDYPGAAAAFEAIGSYSDSANRAKEIRYAWAEKLLEDQDLEVAAEIFEVLASENYLDSEERAHQIRYTLADNMVNEKDYEAAINAFSALGQYSDCNERVNQTTYLLAEAQIISGDLGNAAITFAKLGDYQDARDRSLSVWSQIASRDTISTGGGYTVGVRNNGTIVIQGEQTAVKRKVDDWEDIVAVSSGGNHIVGLKSDGTVIATGRNEYGQCDVENWTDIVSISAGNGYTTGLKMDGTVVATGQNRNGQCNVSDWTDIVMVRAHYGYTIGLRSDGTVVARGFNDDGQCDVDEWRNIVSISGGNGNTLGLKSDGSVVAVGRDINGNMGVEDWSDIMAITTGTYYAAGLRRDGTVVTTGIIFYRTNLDDWKNIVSLAAGSDYVIGLRRDGTVVTAGHNGSWQYDVDTWKNIKIPNN